MPFEIVRNDIVNMVVDAVVNTASTKPIIGYGVDSGIHQKAGSQLLAARQKIGAIHVGDVAMTSGYDLPAKYVLHAVTPLWQGGDHHEEALLQSCYEKALQLAVDNHCESIAFPLMSAGNHGFPKELALQIAIGVFSKFLMQHELQIYLVVFSRDAVALSEKLFHSVASFIDENYIQDKHLAEYGVRNKRDIREKELRYIREEMEKFESLASPTMVGGMAEEDPFADILPIFSDKKKKRKLEDLVNEVDETFTQSLLRLIDQKGLKDPEVYKKANMDRKLFSKIRNNIDYRPTKATAIALAIALELNLDETKDFIGRAGFALTHSSRFDIIIEYFLREQNYDVFEINEVLFAFEQPLIGC